MVHATYEAPHVASARASGEAKCVAACASGDARRDDYDDLATINGGARHLFLPAPGSSGNRERLFDACFGL